MSEMMPAGSPADGLPVRNRAVSMNWSNAGWPRFEPSMPQTFASLEIAAVGVDPAHHLGPAETGRRAREAALAIIGTSALVPGCDALEFRYVVQPRDGGVATVRMFVSAKVLGHGPEAHVLVQQTLAGAVASLPPWFETRSVPFGTFHGDTDQLPVFELRRAEEVTVPVWEYIPADFYYQINDDPGDGSGWSTFWEVLSKCPEPASISIVFKQTALADEERSVLGQVMSQLAVFAETRQDYNLIGHPVTYPGCENARIALDSWQRRVDLLGQRPLVVRIGARCAPNVAGVLLGGLATALARRGDGPGAHPMTIEAADYIGTWQAESCFDWLDICAWGGHPVWSHESAPHSLRRLPYLYGVNEAASLAILPVGDAQGTPGFPTARRSVARRSTASGEGTPSVPIGSYLHHGRPLGEVRVPLAALNRHLLVAGTPGSGKSTTVQSLLVNLWRVHRIPFLVIETVKSEYRNLLTADGFDDLMVIRAGRDDISPLRINPLAPPAGVRRETHASGVLAAMRMAMPLLPPIPQLLEQAIDRAYTLAGWEHDSTSQDGIDPPTLRSLLQSFEAVFASANYRGEATNIAVAFKVRLEGLLSGGRGRMLDTVESTDFDELIRMPTIIELDELGSDEDRALIAALVLERVRSCARRREGKGLQHVVVLEEAHRLLPAATAASEGSGERTRADGVEAFCNAIAELRAAGEGFVICSQSPSRLARASFDLTASRIVHDLRSDADRQVMLDDIGALDTDRELAGRLQAGEALVRWPPMDDPAFVLVSPADGVDTGASVSDDTVRARMRYSTARTRSLLPYTTCTREVCSAGCDPSVRAQGRVVAASVAPVVAQLSALPPADRLSGLVTALATEVGADRTLAFCAISQLHADARIVLPPNRQVAREAVRAAVAGGVG
jgi:DNA helicase HerA-like ATPase